MNSATVLTAAHRERGAYVYVRQSSEFQVKNNVERQRLQYALADHARELGFRDITVIDDDLGISGDGVYRPGFEALLEAVCKGKVGLVLSIEASRLSRNGREWHTLLDFCAIVGCLVGDRDRLYNPALLDDRMYLGLRGQFNEMELAIFRQRSLDSRIALAERGELRMHLPAGLRVGGRCRYRDDPRTSANGMRSTLCSANSANSAASGRFSSGFGERMWRSRFAHRVGDLVWKVPASSTPFRPDSHQPAPCGCLCLWPGAGRKRSSRMAASVCGRGSCSMTPRTGRSCFAITMKATSHGSNFVGTRS